MNNNHTKTTLSWVEAIRYVLDDSPEPMHYTEIAERVVTGNLVDHKGSSPASVVASVLSQYIKSKKKRSLFFKVSRGNYTLTNKAVADDEEKNVIVTCFGMFWERDRIEWTSKPVICGIQYIGSDPVDFCNQIGIYFLYDGREVIYVGRIVDRPLGNRLYEHTRDRLRTRWNRFSWFGLLPVSDTGTLGRLPGAFSAAMMIPTLEAVLIEALEPRQNRKRGDDMSSVEYIQHV